MKLFLTGFMGSGKSKIGRELARRTGIPFYDTDHEIEKEAGMSVREIFDKKGEIIFRKMEGETIRKICRHKHDCIVSLGGGALLLEQSLHHVLENGILIYIQSTPEEIYKRVHHSSKRPLLQASGKVWDKKTYIEQIKNLLKQREPGYLKSHYTISRDGIEAEDIADQIAQHILK